MTRTEALLVMGLVALVPSAGSVIALEAPAVAAPADEQAIATVLGKKLTEKDKDNLDGLIFGALLDRFANENKIEPTKEELDTFVLRLDTTRKQHEIELEQDRQRLIEELKSPSLTDGERKDKESRLRTIERILKTTREMQERSKGTEDRLAAIHRDVAQKTVRMWKINRALYQKYGGRVIFQQAGPEPLDAYRDFLKEQEKKGMFRILDKKYEASFWRYFTDDSMHTFYSKADGARLIDTPWWLMDAPPRESR